MGKMITATEYARRHGRSHVTICQRCARGSFKTAYRSGSIWLIDEDEPLIDNRVTSGNYIDWCKGTRGTGRKRKKKEDA